MLITVDRMLFEVKDFLVGLVFGRKVVIGFNSDDLWGLETLKHSPINMCSTVSLSYLVFTSAFQQDQARKFA